MDSKVTEIVNSDILKNRALIELKCRFEDLKESIDKLSEKLRNLEKSITVFKDVL